MPFIIAIAGRSMEPIVSMIHYYCETHQARMKRDLIKPILVKVGLFRHSPLDIEKERSSRKDRVGGDVRRRKREAKERERGEEWRDERKPAEPNNCVRVRRRVPVLNLKSPSIGDELHYRTVPSLLPLYSTPPFYLSLHTILHRTSPHRTAQNGIKTAKKDKNSIWRGEIGVGKHGEADNLTLTSCGKFDPARLLTTERSLTALMTTDLLSSLGKPGFGNGLEPGKQDPSRFQGELRDPLRFNTQVVGVQQAAETRT
ncbi:hypothetical protein PoB_002141200 [Plakobranchus ocellatus]|uniref:Uncharacterized protein n=1 Tax=Plakobranchus ocellatus TaxID=259542 RepID=A0AAV3ZHV1_9GAST|nr:hypothetical protein PoB_002141200 [Plakobranchus ocellatus]